ncbi:MAG: alkaline phosphatase family protein [Acidobacteriota bacterium]
MSAPRLRIAALVALLIVTGCVTHLPVIPRKAEAPPFERPSFKRIFIVILENEDAGKALDQPFLKQLAGQGVSFSNFYAVAHPSQPNYMALVSGTTDGIHGDLTVTVDRPHLGDLLEAHGRTWKSYAEDYPGGCNLSPRIDHYVRRHEPFLNFRNVQNNPARCANVVGASHLLTDVEAGTLPDFALYIPNNLHNGHDLGIASADRFLAGTFGPLLSDPRFTTDTLFIVTFDESEAHSDQNRIYTVFWGDSVRRGTVADTVYTHYDLLRTIEEAFHLGTLGTHDTDPDTRPIGGVWH